MARRPGRLLDVASPAPLPVEQVVLDMAGTTVEDSGQVPCAFTRALERTGATRVRGVVGVLSGAHSRERLLRAPHSLLLGSVAELPAALAPRLHG